MTIPVVFVTGASGQIGSSTVIALSAKYADKVEIRAGARNPEKADKVKSLAGVTVVQATRKWSRSYPESTPCTLSPLLR